MEVHILLTCSPPGKFLGLELHAVCYFTRTCMLLLKDTLRLCLQLFQLRPVVGSLQAYATRPKGSVGTCSCKYVLVSRLSALGQEPQIS